MSSHALFPPSRTRGVSRGAIFFWGVAGMLLAGLGYLLFSGGAIAWQRPKASKLTLADIPFNGQRAYEHLQAICDIGPRISATQGMFKQQQYLRAHFEKLGGQVSLQEFPVRHPDNGARVMLANMIVQWHPEKKERIMLCCHYDTRPYPDNDPDPRKRKGTFIGANDGASGVALLCEMAEHMQGLKCPYGIDFVLFDAEEFIFDSNRDPFFLGSEHFARQYVAEPPPHRYRCGILVDMIGDKDLQIYREPNSLRTRQTQALVNDIWTTARSLGVREFIPQTRMEEIRDDHLALNSIARIPAINIIDFDYPRARGQTYWHTTQDVPENCSALSLAKVGWVLKEWLERVK
ncbi:MAG TPA: M28 family peptidase [Pirellulaceae bacterium]|nr:M28 family peptidase [Pirellulaceae bacterium]